MGIWRKNLSERERGVLRGYEENLMNLMLGIVAERREHQSHQTQQKAPRNKNCEGITEFVNEEVD